MASGPASFVGDADLHGLVDGHLELDRRTDALRRLATSPADRARVEGWQKQNDLLRTAFAGVVREPLPVMLDLKARPRLHCVPADESERPGVVAGGQRPRRRVSFAVATILLVAACVAGTWIVMNVTDPDDPATAAKVPAFLDATLAGRSAEAMRGTASSAAQSLQIPDLRKAGFNFAGAEFDTAEPPSILFRYKSGEADHLVISVARGASQEGSDATPVRIGDAYSWHRRDIVFAIAGTVSPARLRAIAAALQGRDARD